MPEAVSEAVHEALPDPLRAALSAEATAELVAQGAEAWPQFSPSSEALARCLAVKLADTEPSKAAEALDRLDAPELWLGAAVAEGSDAAAAAFDRRYISAVAAAVAHMGLQPAQVDDLSQRVREKLLVPPGEGRPVRLLGYCGAGRLAALVKVIALRTATDDLRQRQRHPEHDPAAQDDAVDVLMHSALTPELEAVKQQHRAAFKAAFAQALTGLPIKERGVLRLHLIERLNIDAIAALHDVHRATAARWLARIREQLETGTREALRRDLALSATELDAVVRALQTQLDLSLTRLLSPDAT